MSKRCHVPAGNGVSLHFILSFVRKVSNINFLFLEPDPCNPNVCQNGGQCSDFNGAATCSCEARYSGNKCEGIGGYFRVSCGYDNKIK